MGPDKQQGTRMNKNIILCFHSSTMTHLWSRRANTAGEGERERERERETIGSHEEAVGTRNCQRELTSAKILDII